LNKIIYESGSFRDPAGRIFFHEDLVYREIFQTGKERIKFLQDNNILKEIIENDFLIESQEVNDLNLQKVNKNSIIFKHEKLKFISYPYEWTFNELKDAAIFHLNFQLFLLEKNAKLIDASAYNIQFRKNKPIFIDLLSIDKYNEGEYWNAHKQFCENFLNPLILTAKKGINFNNWFRGNLEGISTSELSSILNLKEIINPTIFFHVYLLNKIENKAIKNPKKAALKIKKSRGLSKKSFKSMLIGLKNFINSLNSSKKMTVWDKYSVTNTYTDEEESNKVKVVNNFLGKNSFNFIADLGCNDGKYSNLAINSGVKTVIGFDFDLKVLDKAYLNAKKKGANFLPLYLDLTNPSGNLGWDDKERKSFKNRSNFDGILALALVHHLAIAKNIPLDQILNWITKLAPKGIIEFVPKNDPTTQLMLNLKGDIFPDYNEKNFHQILSTIANVDEINTVSKHNRKIYEYTRI